MLSIVIRDKLCLELNLLTLEIDPFGLDAEYNVLH